MDLPMMNFAPTSAPYRLGIVIPAYNEAVRLPGTLAAMAAARPTLPGVDVIRIMVASNASTDRTVAVAHEAAERYKLPLIVTEYSLKGKARAVRAGMLALAGAGLALDGLLFMDADNATDLSEFARFDLADRDAIQIASRHAPGAVIEHLGGPSRSRETMALGSRLLTRLALGLHLSDTQCGFKLFPVATVAPLFGALRTASWMFDAELLARAQIAGITLREVPVRWVEMPGSKVRPIIDTIGSLRGLWEVRQTLAREREESLSE